MNFASGGLDDFDILCFVCLVGLVYDYMFFLDKYDVLEIFGVGGFVVVCKVKYCNMGEIVVVKTFRVEGLGGDSDDEGGSELLSDEDSDDEDEF